MAAGWLNGESHLSIASLMASQGIRSNERPTRHQATQSLPLLFYEIAGVVPGGVARNGEEEAEYF